MSTTDYPRFVPVGDTALTVEFGDAIDPRLNAAVIALDLALAAAELPGIVETVPAYRSLLVCYEPGELPHATLVARLRALIAQIGDLPERSGRRWVVPVSYGGTHGDDLEEAAAVLGLPPERVVELHSGGDYLVYLVGFHPGTPNLGGLPAPLHIPRRRIPRPLAPPCSVAIGGMQTGITAVASPTGWYVLGRTPVRPFDAAREPDPFLFRPGDRIRFDPVEGAEFDRLAARAAAGEPIARLQG